jgi:hypothetical protein
MELAITATTVVILLDVENLTGEGLPYLQDS